MAKARELTQRVTFATVARQSDGGGGTVEKVEDQFTVWAKRHFLRGSEGVQAARLQSRQPMIITIRASAQTKRISPEWRARDAQTGVDMQIRTVEPSRDRRWIDLLCESGVAS